MDVNEVVFLDSDSDSGSDEVDLDLSDSDDIKKDEFISPELKIDEYLFDAASDFVSDVGDSTSIISWKSARETTTSREVSSDLEVEPDSESLQSDFSDDDINDDSDIKTTVLEASGSSTEGELSEKSIDIDELSDFADLEGSVVVDELTDFSDLEFEGNIADESLDIDNKQNIADQVSVNSNFEKNVFNQLRNSDSIILDEISQFADDEKERNYSEENIISNKSRNGNENFEKNSIFNELSDDGRYNGLFNFADYVFSLLENPENENDAVDLADISSQENDDDDDLGAALEQLDILSTPVIADDVVFDDPEFAVFNEFLNRKRGSKLSTVVKEFMTIGDIPSRLIRLNKHELEIELSEYVVRKQKAWRYRQLEKCYFSIDGNPKLQKFKTIVNEDDFVRRPLGEEVAEDNPTSHSTTGFKNEVLSSVGNIQEQSNQARNDVHPSSVGNDDDDIIFLEVRKTPQSSGGQLTQDRNFSGDGKDMGYCNHDRKRPSLPLEDERPPKLSRVSPISVDETPDVDNQRSNLPKNHPSNTSMNSTRICRDPNRKIEVVTID